VRVGEGGVVEVTVDEANAIELAFHDFAACHPTAAHRCSRHP
jgi:hypothetical protein